MKSNTKRAYELKHKYFSRAQLLHEGNEPQEFTYGIVTDRTTEAQVIHGWQGQNATIEIGTCDDIEVAVGDRVVFENGRISLVQSWINEVIDLQQLQFIKYEYADKVTRITLQNLGV